MSDDSHPPTPPSWDPPTLPLAPLGPDTASSNASDDTFPPGYLPAGALPPPFVPRGLSTTGELAAPPGPVPLEPVKQKTNNTGRILGIIAALIVVGGTVTVGVLLTRNDSASTSSQSATTDQQVNASTTVPTSDRPVPPAVPTSQVPFGQGLPELTTKLEGASGDLCALLNLGNSSSAVADPLTVDEVKQAGDYVAKYVTYIADALPSKLSSDAALLREGAALIPSELANAKYDPTVLSRSLSVFDSKSKYGPAFDAVFVQRQTSC